MSTLVERLSNRRDYFLRLSEFTDLSAKVFLMTIKFSQFDYSTMFRKSNVNK